MQRLGTGLVYHLTVRNVICSKCAAPWEERFVGIGTATDGAIKPLCPRCIPEPLTVEELIEAEIAEVLQVPGADPDHVRESTAARYKTFLARRHP
jgi:hypothetical protein